MKKSLMLCTAILGSALVAAACGESDDPQGASNGAALSIMGKAETCADKELAYCLCQDGGWGLQACLGGAWGSCICSDAGAATADSEPADQAASAGNVFGGVFFSEYVEGSSNNKAIEVHNASASPAECTIRLYTNGSTSASNSVDFTVEAGATGAFCNGGAVSALKGRCFATSGVASFNGDDALELICGGATVDVFGHIGTRPTGGKWVQGSASTQDMTLRRKAEVLSGNAATDAAFSALATEWEALAKDTFDGIGAHAVTATAEPLPTDPAGDDDPAAEEPADAGQSEPPTEEPTPEDPVVEEPEVELADWTFMVFMNGDNNLYQYAASDFKEMQKMTNGDDLNVIVLYDDYGRNNTKLYRVQPGGKELLDSGSEIFSGSEADMGDWKTLRNFGVWSIKNYPAKRYALIMWNHGGGWKDGVAEASPLFKDFSNDEYGNYEGIYLSTGDYAKALAPIAAQAGQKLDLLGFDACLMAMYEVAAASAPYGNLLVASEETEPANGWSYDYFLPLLSKAPTMDAVTFAKHISDGYYKAGEENVTSSVIDLTSMDALNTKLDAFADALKAANAKSTIKSIRSGLIDALPLAVEEHIDLRQFAKKVAQSSAMSSSVKVVAEALDAQLGETILYERAHNYYDTYYRQQLNYDTNTFGMAIYFPASKSTADWNYYKKGIWYSQTSWGEFLLNNF